MIPKLRFPDFADDWQSARLGDFFTFKNGVNADKSMYGTGRKFINVMDVIADSPITHDAIIGSVEISDNEFAKNKVVYGDVLFQRSSETREEVGQSNIYIDQKPATFGGFVIRGHPKQVIDPYYFDALLKTAPVRKDMTSRSGGSTRYNIGQESLDAVSVCVAPSLAEQRKIAAFLAVVDTRVGLLRRRREALERYKKGMMQRLFAETVRFKRDNGTAYPDWLETRLGNVASFHRGAFLPKSDIDENGPLPCIHYGELFTHYTEIIRSVRSKTSALDPAIGLVGDVIMPSSDVTPDGLAKASALLVEGVRLGGDINIVRPSSALLAQFFAYWVTQNRKLVMRLVSGTTVKHLYLSDLKKLPIHLPHPDEQRKIADFLSALGDKISAVSAKIDAMQAFKKGLLQQMFV